MRHGARRIRALCGRAETPCSPCLWHCWRYVLVFGFWFWCDKQGRLSKTIISNHPKNQIVESNRIESPTSACPAAFDRMLERIRVAPRPARRRLCARFQTKEQKSPNSIRDVAKKRERNTHTHTYNTHTHTHNTHTHTHTHSDNAVLSTSYLRQ
jgi:hypothetical protein